MAEKKNPDVSPGDFLVRRPLHGPCTKVRVERITATGRVVLEKGQGTLNPDLSMRGWSSKWMGSPRFSLLTPEAEAVFRREALTRRVRDFDLDHLTLAELSQIVAVLDSANLRRSSEKT